jgi:pimeloyl-ACP methyl ester carboxylesterase
VLIDGPDARLWVEVAGRGKPVTVFAHGLTSSSADIADLARRVPGSRVLFDFRGHGRSDSPPAAAGYDIDAMARDLCFVARRFGATHAAGVSMGASAITAVIEQDLARFERALLIIPARADGPEPAAEEYASLAAELESGIALEDLAREILGRGAVRDLIRRAPVWEGRIRAQILRMNRTGIPRALRAAAASPPPVRNPERLARRRTPVLVAGHEGDAAHDAGVARRLADLFPHSELEMWANVLEMLDDMESFSARIGTFFAGAPAPVR